MAERRPLNIACDAQQQVTGLKIISSLNAPNELGEAAVDIVVWNIQIAAGPRPDEIRANVKSRPVVWRHYNRERLRRHIRSMRYDASADCNKCDAAEK